MAAAPALHLVNMPADAKAEVRFHKMEIVEAQDAEQAPEPTRQLSVLTGHNFADPNSRRQSMAPDQISGW